MLPCQSRSQPPAPAFKRTTQACRHCQSRKIRCDRRIHGSTCTNCRLDAIECVPGKSKPARSEKRRSTKSSSPNRLTAHRESGHDTMLRETSISASTASPTIRLPNFISPLVGGLSPEDTAYLEHKGVFDIPNTNCRNELLRSYFLFSYPLLPLLDVESFLAPMLKDDTGGKVSLLLFYAVMCSGAAHVDMQVLRELGFKSRKLARSAFFERARLLYDLDCERDRVSLVQAFLLMTYWYDARETHKDRKFWIRVAVTLAQDLGLDLHLDSCGTKQHRMLKRLWWCCFMRDQFVALMTWTPPQLGARHRHLPLLELDDFEMQDFSPAVSRMLEEWHFVDNQRSRIRLATLCIEKAKLCVSINEILQARYSSLRYESESRMMTILVPRQSSANAFEILELDRQLQEWYRGLSNSGKFDLRDPTDSAFMKTSNVIAMHRAHLKLLFLSAMIALHRPQVSETAGMLPPTYQQLSQMKLRDAADEVAHVAISIKNLEMGTHMTPRGVTLLLPIMLVHLQDVMPEMQRPQRSRLEKYYDCMRILDSIGGDGAPEDILPSKLEAAFLKFNILPSTERSIPPSISFNPNFDDLPFSRNRFFSCLSQLGAITPSEIDLLSDMSLSRGRMSDPGECDRFRHQEPASYGSLPGQIMVGQPQMDLHLHTSSLCGAPIHYPSEEVLSIQRTVDPRQIYPTSTSANFDISMESAKPRSFLVEPGEDDTIMEHFFKWRVERTKIPLQRQLVESAYETVLTQMWSSDDLRAMENIKSDLYRLAIQQGIPDGLARGFRKELDVFLSQWQAHGDETSGPKEL
ncbi:uncharacterized protein PV07_03508 [Cladophialophora immunda]|uniref:Zn(2)-C6 fungal-type domain-containing protein n=1 Tax=Cladophialophora immunda TaxID=569365 RepID=A0A0D1ZUW9_9EURO|nr:uncharacterized protein PV07_03508 [Cladophialophora immunda]KIW31921.1 hypothetical protein PV07_03508 [Cladophialophora immunda]OQU98347.1 Fungal specific transcription factor domain-containing protein [Cladophialophora immunda]